MMLRWGIVYVLQGNPENHSVVRIALCRVVTRSTLRPSMPERTRRPPVLFVVVIHHV